MLFRYACSMYGFGLIKRKSKDGEGCVKTSAHRETQRSSKQKK